MECPSIPFQSARRPRAHTLAGGLALVLLTTPMATSSAQAEPLKEIGSSFDEAGRALNRQIGDWVGTPQKPRAPAKKREPPANAKAGDAKNTVAKPATAPLPPNKPADASDSAAAPTPQANPKNVTSKELPPASAGSTAAAEPTPTPAEPAAKPPPQVAARAVETKPVETAATKPVPLPPTRPAEPQAPRETAAAPAPAESAPAEAPASEKPGERRVAAIPAPTPAPTQPAAPAPQTTATICPELSNDDLGKFEPYVVTATNPLCTVDRGVSLSAVRMKDGRMVELAPAAVLRCEMAASVAHWLREKVDPAVATLGSPLDKVMVAASQQCRPRNRVAGAKISEHGRGNGLDTRGYVLEDGRRIVIGPPGGSGEQAMPVAFQEKLKLSACADFTTILGPGSDGYHEQHLHVDRAQRRSGAVLCQWSTANVTAKVPKPPAKPADISTETPAATPADEADEEEGPGEGPAVRAP